MTVDASVLPVALDHNFPTPLLRCLAAHMVDVRLVPLNDIDPRLRELDDRALIVALSQLGWTCLVTNNYKMLRNPSELAAVLKTRLTVFAIQGVGDDPLRAIGALLLDLPGAIKRLQPGKGQVYWLRPRNPVPLDPWKLLVELAGHRNVSPDLLYQETRVSDEEMARPVLL